ncbi:MAG: hypothetical protein AAGG51_14935 [Cyanobacteria bacterium P01_G01_bin.54]
MSSIRSLVSTLPRVAIASTTLAITLWGVSAPAQVTINPAPQQRAQLPAGNREAKLLHEINRVRSNPARYAIWLESLRQYYNGNTLTLPGQAPIQTQAGVVALNEAIRDLQMRRPVLPLTPSDLLVQQARNALNGSTSGNTARLDQSDVPLWAVMHLVIADGQDSTARHNLLSVAHRSTGVACAPNSAVCWVSYNSVVSEPPVVAAAPVNAIPITPIPLESPPPVEPPPIELTPIEPLPIESVIPDPVPSEVTPVPTVEPTPTAELPEIPPSNGTADTLGPITPEAQPDEDSLETPPEALPTPVAVQPTPPPTLPEAVVEPLPETTPVIETPSIDPDPQIASLLSPEPAAQAQGYLFLRQGALEASDRRYDDGSFYDEHLFRGGQGQSIVINLSSTEFDTFLAVFDANGQEILAQNDDAGGTSNSSVTITLPYDGLYRIFVNGYNETDLGSYAITIQ